MTIENVSILHVTNPDSSSPPPPRLFRKELSRKWKKTTRDSNRNWSPCCLYLCSLMIGEGVISFRNIWKHYFCFGSSKKPFLDDMRLDGTFQLSRPNWYKSCHSGEEGGGFDSWKGKSLLNICTIIILPVIIMQLQASEKLHFVMEFSESYEGHPQVAVFLWVWSILFLSYLHRIVLCRTSWVNMDFLVTSFW